MVDARSDVYSLGCMLFECLTGSVPFRRGSEFEVLYAQLSEEPPSISEQRPDLPREFDRVAGACAREGSGGAVRDGGSARLGGPGGAAGVAQPAVVDHRGGRVR